MSTKWAHLPNAKYIDQILADVAAKPAVWNEAYTTRHTDAADAAYSAAREAPVWNVEWDTAWSALLDATWDATSGSVRDAARITARGAMLALIVDDCAYLLNEEVEHVHLLSILGDNAAAILLYPACVAMNSVDQ